jgi:DNA (cytosine-5)-methyltransferase 1
VKFVDLFAGLGGFHKALSELGHECVFASEIDPELQNLYRLNFPESKDLVHGDITKSIDLVPEHDILVAGFPCQPFSKSGYQWGREDTKNGTLFSYVLEVAGKFRPSFVILENVGNFERHDKDRTWAIVRQSLEEIGYSVAGMEHIASGGSGLISPHHLGFPHQRERREQLVAHDFESAQNKYDWSVVVEMFESLYLELASD